MKRAEKSKRFSQVVDQRMSTISTDWRSISGAGANAAIRASMTVDSSAYGRPASFLSTTESGQAGIGSRFNNMDLTEQDVPRMSQLRGSVMASGERSSRVVSFASDPRHSLEAPQTPHTVASGSRRIYTRSFHQAQNFGDEDDIHNDLQISPRQSLGPAALSNAEIEVRASTGNESLRREMLQMPAMTLMRTGKQTAGPNNDLILPAPILRDSSSSTSGSPAVPLPTFQATSPIPPSRMGAMSPPMNPALSPDDLLRAYAAGRAPSVHPGTVLGSGAQTISGGTANTGMRILYSPSEDSASSQMVASPAYKPIQIDNNPFRASMAARSVYTVSVYSGNVDVDGDHEDPYAGYGAAK